MRLLSGNIILGDKTFSMSDVESFERNFERNNNGFYFLKLKSVKKKLGISPDYSDNIVATLSIF